MARPRQIPKVRIEVCFFDCLNLMIGVRRTGWYARRSDAIKWQGPYTPTDIQLMRLANPETCVAVACGGLSYVEDVIAAANLVAKGV